MSKRILVTGGAGFFGSQIVTKLWESGYGSIIVPRSTRFDLREKSRVQVMFDMCAPDIVIHAAAHCGGIGLNKARPGELFYDNMMMGLLMMDQAHRYSVEKFVQIGTVCEYPKFAKVPFIESEIWDGYPEETNAPYGIAKKALLVQGQAYRQQYGMNIIHLLPVNLYGPGDNFDPESSHVIPALIRKIAEAKKANARSINIWGSGTISREFLYVEDAADAVVKAMIGYNEPEPINIGSGVEITISRLANLIADIIGYEGEFLFDSSMPDGQPRRVLATNLAKEKFGFQATTKLEIGLDKTIKWWYDRS